MDVPQSVSDWEPISISSVIVRTRNRILLRRINADSLVFGQRVFVERDGYVGDTVILQDIVRYARRLSRPHNILALEVRKAFDNVSHDAIRRQPPRRAQYVPYEHRQNCPEAGTEAIPLENVPVAQVHPRPIDPDVRLKTFFLRECRNEKKLCNSKCYSNVNCSNSTGVNCSPYEVMVWTNLKLGLKSSLPQKALVNIDLEEDLHTMLTQMQSLQQGQLKPSAGYR